MLAHDSSLWRHLYIERFAHDNPKPRDRVHRKERPRRRVLRSIPRKSARDSSCAIAKDWKSQYKVRHKWANGSCTFHEIILAGEGEGNAPRVLLCVHGSIAITADESHGMRGWTVKDHEQSLLATNAFSQGMSECERSRPNAIAVAIRNSTSQLITFAIGFANGSLNLCSFDVDARRFRILSSFRVFDNSRVDAIDVACPYVFSMSQDHSIAVYDVSGTLSRQDDDGNSPRLLSYLSSNTTGEPLSLTSRKVRQNTIISIAYACPSYLTGWTLGLQELELNPQGVFIQSRIATAQSSHRRVNLSSSSDIMRARGRLRHGSLENSKKPSAITYAHPYLLATFADNTLGFHLVRSSNNHLSMSPEFRLWGHTASISAACIGERGKTVTVAQGSDVRVWDLEEAFNSEEFDVASVRLQPEKDRDKDGHSYKNYPSNLAVLPDYMRSMSNWQEARPGIVRSDRGVSVVFDEERLVVLQDASSATRSFRVYDFT